MTSPEKANESTRRSSIATIDLSRIEVLWDQLQGADSDTVKAALENSDLDPDAIRLLRSALSQDTPDSLLDRPIDDVALDLLGEAAATLPDLPQDLSGRLFGSWRAVEEIGRGGMGAVLLAERADGQFEKTVAIKVIKPGRYTQHSRVRFLEEMQMLARLEHPGIVRLIDGGITEDGVPWFAMEHVEGESITDYADRTGKSPRKSIDLIIQVCDAVEHAHRHLVVHGDIKPSNIMITDTGQVRLVDFGIARSLLDNDPEDLVRRCTPRYAAPEVLAGDGINTTSDVFSVTAVLLELYLGASETTLPDQSASTSSDPNCQKKLGELHWIIDAGMASNPTDRLPSIAAVRAELRRFLEQRPLESHPASRVYRVRKFLQRNRIPVAAAAIATLALIAGTAAALIQAAEARREADKAQWTTNFLLELFDSADPWKNQQEPITVDELTDSAVSGLLNAPEGLPPDVRAEAASILARVESRLGDYRSTSQLLESKIEFLRQRSAPNFELADALTELGVAQVSLDEMGPALESFQEAATLHPLTDTPDRVSVRAANHITITLAHLNDTELARTWLDKLLARTEAISKLEDGETLLALVYRAEGNVLHLEGRLDEALEAAQRALSHAENSTDESAPVLVANKLLEISQALYQKDRSEEALELDRQVLAIFEQYHGPDNPQTLEARGRVAVSLRNLGRPREAIEVYMEILEGQRESLGPDSQYVAATLGNIGIAYLALGEAGRALEYIEQAQIIWEDLDPPQPVQTSLNRIGIGRALHQTGDWQAADRAFERSLSELADTLTSDHPLYRRAQVYYAPLLLDQGKYQRASEMLPEAYRIIEATYGQDSRHTAVAGLRWAQLLFAQGVELERARTLARNAREVLEDGVNAQVHGPELLETTELLARLED